MTDDPWTEDAVACLRRLWQAGRPTAEIGRRLGISKNAVIGKARRLHLQGRPNPVGQPRSSQRQDRRPAQRREPARTHPADLNAGAAISAPARLGPAPIDDLPRRARAPGPAPACCWPIGEPGRAGFRFCGEPASDHKPYCPTHAGLAYASPKAARARTDGGRLDRFLARLPPQL